MPGGAFSGSKVFTITIGDETSSYNITDEIEACKIAALINLGERTERVRQAILSK